MMIPQEICKVEVGCDVEVVSYGARFEVTVPHSGRASEHWVCNNIESTVTLLMGLQSHRFKVPQSIIETIEALYRSDMSNLGLVVAHLNASTGPVLSLHQLAAVLREGSLDVLSDAPGAAAVASYLFVEVEPRLIVLCAYECGADVHHANRLYNDLLLRSMPRVPAWESSVAVLL